MLSLCFSLFSCGSEKADGEIGGSGSNTSQGTGDKVDLPKGDYIFAPGSTISIVTNSYADSAKEISGRLWQAIGTAIETKNDSAPMAAHEVIIGETGRDLSKTAYRQLQRLKDEKEEHEGYVGYVIYTDGNSVAIAFDVDDYGYNTCESLAIDYFLSKVMSNNSLLTLNKGVVAESCFDLLAYQEKIEDAEKEAKWAAVERTLSQQHANGKEIADALKYYVQSTGTDGVVGWLADLYDLEAGGFYFSNSGRNTVGYGPDIESTSQAVGFFISSGMFRSNADYPDWFIEKLVYFVKSLQDPNGRIYHPQWDRETLEKNTSRMGRDAGSAYQILSRFGRSPTYPIQGYEKDLEADYIDKNGNSVRPAAALTWRFNTSTVSAVSKVVPASLIAGFAHLENVESFKDYLDDQSARNQLPKTNNRYRSFYQIANELCTQAMTILERDEALNNGGAMRNMVINWLNEHQNKDTGLWDPGVGYDNTNAYYKAINFYNTMAAPMPNADKAIESIITVLMSDDPVETILYTFNVWGSLNQTMINLTSHANNKALVAAARAKLIELAPVAVRSTADIQLMFQKSDGSFGYFKDKTTNVSQNMPVAVANSNEGDVNCTTLTIGGILSSMVKTLGVSGFPANYTRVDGIRCMERIKALGPVIKNDETVIVDYLTFDDDAIGGEPALGIKAGTLTSGHFTVVSAPTKEDSGNKAVEFRSGKTYESIEISSVGVGPASSCFVFESDICIPEGGEFAELQILMQNSTYMLTIETEGEDVRVWETSSRKPDYAVETEIDACAKVGEWFNLKMEYYLGDKDTARAKIYFNGKLVAVTDNFFDDTGAKLSGDAVPKNSFDYVNIISVSSYNTIIRLDNVAAYATTVQYKVEKNVDINIDAPDKDRVLHDFDSGSLSEDIIISSGEGSITIEESPKTNSSSLKLAGDYDIYLPIVKRISGSGVKTVVFESDVYVGDSVGDLFRIYYRENNTKKQTLTSYDLKVVDTADGRVVKLLPVIDEKAGVAVDNVAIPVSENFNLRIEYYEEEFATLIFINDSLAAMTPSTCKGAPRLVGGLLEIKSMSSANTVYLDNLFFEKDKLSFAESAAPTGKSEVHDFSSSDSLVSLSGGAVIENEVAKLPANLSSIKVDATANGVVLMAANISADIKLSEAANDTYRFTVYSEDDKAIIAFDLVINGGKAVIREYYAGGSGTDISKTSINGDSLNITFKYYYKEHVMKVWINDTFVALNSLGYIYENEALMMSYVMMTKVSGSGSAFVDNVIAENTLEFYIEESSSDIVLDPKNDTTFEKTHAANPPASTNYDKVSTGSLLGVKGMELENGQYSKFLSLYTTPGGNDILDFQLLEADKLAGAKAVIFETDIYFDCDDDKSNAAVEIYFVNSSGKKGWYTSVTFNRGGNITLSDYKNGVSSLSGTKLATESKLFKLRIEYVVVDGRLFVNFYVDGEYVCMSTVLFGIDEPFAPEDITVFKFYTANAASGRILVDNSRIYQSNTYTDFELPEPPAPPVVEPEEPVVPDPKPDEPDQPITPDPKPNEPTGPETGEVRPSPNPDVGFDDVTGTEPTEPDNGETSDGGGWT